MIEAISNRLAVKMKEINPEETASVEVMSYALQGILHNLITLITAIIVGSVLGQFWETLLAAACVAVLRWFSGGLHFKSALSCFLTSASVFIVIPLIEVSDQILLITNIVSLLLVAIFAPSNIRGHIRIPEKYFPLYKLASIIIVSINFFILTPIITIAFFVQSCTTITFKKEV